MSRPRTTLILAVAAQAAVSVIQFGLPAVGLDVRERLDLGPAGFGAIFACLGIGSAIALVPLGVLVDRFGSRLVLVLGGALAAAGDLGAAFAHSAGIFAAFALLAGVGGAAVPVAGMTALLRGFPPERRGMALGWRQLAVPLGGTIGSFALPALNAVGGLRLAFAAAACACAATAGAFAWLAGSGPDHTGQRLSLDGVLRIPGMGLLLLLGLLYGTALGGPLAYLVPAARDAGLTAAAAGGLFTLLNVTAALARLIWGRAADRRGGTRRIAVLRATGGLAAVAAALMPLALAGGIAFAVPVVAALGLGVLGFNGVFYVVAGELAGPARAGRAVGVASTVVFGAGSLAAPFVGALIEGAGYDAVWATTAVCAVAGVFTTRRLARVARPFPVDVPAAAAAGGGR